MNSLSTDATGVKTAEIKRLHEVARANARTITDLLAALREAAEYIERLGYDPEDFAYARELQGIVAKAEGR